MRGTSIKLGAWRPWSEMSSGGKSETSLHPVRQTSLMIIHHRHSTSAVHMRNRSLLAQSGWRHNISTAHRQCNAYAKPVCHHDVASAISVQHKRNASERPVPTGSRSTGFAQCPDNRARLPTHNPCNTNRLLIGHLCNTHAVIVHHTCVAYNCGGHL